MNIVSAKEKLIDMTVLLRHTVGVKRLSLSLFLFQILAILDLVGVLIFGFIGSVVLNGINPQLNILNFEVFKFLSILDSFSLQVKVLTLTILAVLLLLARSIASLYFTRKNLFFLGARAARLSGDLIRQAIVRKRQKSDLSSELYTVTTGVQQLFSQVVANLLGTIADVLLTLTFIIGIMFIDILASITVALSFTLIAALMHKVIASRVRKNGREIGLLFRNSQQEVINAVSLHKEISLRGLEITFGDRIAKGRENLIKVLVPNQIYGLMNKYVIEIFLLFLISLIAGVLFLIYDAGTGFAKLAVFFVASSRLAPAVMRLQNSAIQVLSHLEQSKITLQAIRELMLTSGTSMDDQSQNESATQRIPPTICMKDVKYKHEDVDSKIVNWAIAVRKLCIKPGKKYSITGKSGSGKTTFIDLILGFKVPQEGKIQFLYDNKEVVPFESMFGYVPQDVYLIPGTIRDNISLYETKYLDSPELIWSSIELAGLEKWISGLPEGLDTIIGSGGVVPSGGQRQRIGLARCLISKPVIMVLDEVTSGLDIETERELISQMSRIPWENTQIWVTHRKNVREFADFEIRVSDRGRVSLRDD